MVLPPGTTPGTKPERPPVIIATARPVTPVPAGTKGTAGTPGKMVLSTEDGSLSLVVRYAPKAITYSNLARTWTEVPRPGRMPILSAQEKPLRKLGYDIILASTDPDVSMESDFKTLVALGQTEQRIRVQFGPAAETGLWRITALSVASVERHATTQAIIQAVGTLELTRASDHKKRTGPVKGGAAPPPTKPRYYGGVKYRVKKGDTLRTVSTKFYKTPKHWKLIADANKIRKPQPGQLKIGMVLKIPRIKQ
jgi:nucleoid-associated protein YgaU